MNDFDHVVIPHLPGWVREPPDDYQDDEEDDPGYDDILTRDDQPLAIVIGGCIATWDDNLETFIPLEDVEFRDGKLVRR